MTSISNNEISNIVLMNFYFEENVNINAIENTYILRMTI